MAWRASELKKVQAEILLSNKHSINRYHKPCTISKYHDAFIIRCNLQIISVFKASLKNSTAQKHAN